MNLSLGEFEALCRKAVRGAGFEWGLAEEAGRAVRRLASFGLPGAEMLAARLRSADRHRYAANPLSPGSIPAPIPGSVAGTFAGVRAGEGGWLCPILSGTVLSDAAGACIEKPQPTTAHTLVSANEWVLHDVLTPLLLVPFAGLAARQMGVPLSVAWADIVITDDGQTLWIDGPAGAAFDEVADVVRCRTTDANRLSIDRQVTPVERASPDPRCYEHLEAFAQRTYAPATEESRQRGAG